MRERDIERNIEQLSEDFEQKKKEVFGDYLTNDCENEVFDFVVSDPELFALLTRKWLENKKKAEELFEYYLASFPEGPDDTDDCKQG